MPTGPMCQNVAKWKRWWPGREPDLVCDEHRDDSVFLAMVMGFLLPIVQLVEGDRPWQCACSPGRLQRIAIKTSEAGT